MALDVVDVIMTDVADVLMPDVADVVMTDAPCPLAFPSRPSRMGRTTWAARREKRRKPVSLRAAALTRPSGLRKKRAQKWRARRQRKSKSCPGDMMDLDVASGEEESLASAMERMLQLETGEELMLVGEEQVVQEEKLMDRDLVMRSPSASPPPSPVLTIAAPSPAPPAEPAAVTRIVEAPAVNVVAAVAPVPAPAPVPVLTPATVVPTVAVAAPVVPPTAAAPPAVLTPAIAAAPDAASSSFALPRSALPTQSRSHLRPLPRAAQPAAPAPTPVAPVEAPTPAPAPVVTPLQSWMETNLAPIPVPRRAPPRAIPLDVPATAAVPLPPLPYKGRVRSVRPPPPPSPR